MAEAEPTSDEPAVEAEQQETPSAETEAKPKRSSTASVRDFVKKNVRLVLALVFLVAGILLVILGWYGAAHTNILTEQIPYFISGGLLGMALIIVAGVIGSSAGLERDNRELRHDLMNALETSPVRVAPAGGATAAPRRTGDGMVYLVPGGRSYHLAGCPIVEGKEGSELTQPDAVAAGFTVCKLCGTD